MPDIPFRKLHGLGNDFIVLDGLRDELPLETLTDPDVARRLCHRHLGVGADGLLLILPAKGSEARAQMQVINADGSEAETCGNGLRCVAKLLGDHDPELSKVDEILIETASGPSNCTLTREQGLVRSVRVEMGAPKLERSEIPMRGQGQLVDETIEIDDIKLRATAVNMGNPHVVIFGDEDGREPAERLGPLLEDHPAFPARINVGFAQQKPSGLVLWVWERGCGLTQACGSGACAAVVAAVLTERHPTGVPMSVTLPGGPLQITVAADLSQVWMTGPAEEVYSGTLSLP